MSDYRVSTHILNKIPSYIKDDYNRFVSFIQDCYKSQERSGAPLDLLRNVLTYKNLTTFDKLTESTVTLSSNINETINVITVNNGETLPKTNGVIRIDDEIILYKYRENNTLYDCLRGASYITEINSIFLPPNYERTVSSSHLSGAKIQDLTILVSLEFLNQTYLNFVPDLKDELINSSVRRSTLIEKISSFYRSKGSSDGIKILFKFLYGNSLIDVSYPGEQILKSSDSTWTQVNLLLCQFISGDMSILEGNSLFSDPVTPVATVESVKMIPIGDDYIYEVYVNSTDNKNPIIPVSRTVLGRSVGLFDTTITVESTMGFPEKNGKFYIGDELIEYRYKTSNRFHECIRATSPGTYLIGEDVYADNGLIFCTKGNTETVIRVFNIVNGIDIQDGGLFYNLDDKLEFGYTGKLYPNEPLVESWIENTNYSLANVYDTTIADVSDYTYGINSIYFDKENVFVQSSSLPPLAGPFGSAGAPDLKPVNSYCKFPLQPIISVDSVTTGKESTGMFVDGILAQSCTTYERIISGPVTSINLVSNGIGYKNPPSVIVIGGGGSGVVANANISNGRVTSITLVNGGSNFTSIPTVKLTTGEGASVLPTLDKYGRLKSVQLIDGGNYYTGSPEVVIVDPEGKGRGGQLTIDPSLIVNGVIQPNAIKIVSAGIDYSSSSYILVKPIGQGATATCEVYGYDFDSYRHVIENPNFDFDSRGGFVYPRLYGTSYSNNTYCYSVSPSSLRNELNDDGTQHSPILGFAFDGCPIYGPYGYSSPLDSTSFIKRMESSYTSISRPGTNPPSVISYPLGSFLQDYTYSSGLGDLDEHNGRYCVTPEYPNGVYAYFITVDELNTPVFPYIIGPTFKYLPVSQSFNFLNESLSKDPVLFSSVNYGENLIDYNYSGVVRRRNSNLISLNQNLSAKINQVHSGAIQKVYVDDSDNNYAVGDSCLFEYQPNEGGGCEAIVDYLYGKEITNLQIAIPSIKVFIRDYSLDLSEPITINFNSNDISLVNGNIDFGELHNFIDGTRVLFENINGIVPEGLRDNRVYYIKVVNSTTVKLATSLRNLQNNIFVIITNSGTGDKSLTPVYSFTEGMQISTEGGCEFVVKNWNKTTKVLNIFITNDVKILNGDIFTDNYKSKVYVPTGSITQGVVTTTTTEISVNNINLISRNDLIQIGSESMVVSDIKKYNTLVVKRTDEIHPVIYDSSYVVNLSKLALIITTQENHNLLVGDGIRLVNALPDYVNGIVEINKVIDSKKVLAIKSISPSDSQQLFESIISPSGLAFVASSNPYFLLNPSSGTLWWSSLTGNLHIYYEDVDSGQWVTALPNGVIPDHIGDLTIPSSISGNPPSTSNIISENVIQISEVAPSTRYDDTELISGDFWWSSLTGTLYVYYDGFWVPTTPTGVVSREDDGAIAPSVNYTTGTSIQRQAIVTISENAPTNGVEPVENGDLWWSPLSGILYIRYNSTWVIATPIGNFAEEGSVGTALSGISSLEEDYLTVLSATGDYFYITNSPSAVGRIYSINVLSQGSELFVLPKIVGIIPRELDRCTLSILINENNGSIEQINVINGGIRYKNPSVFIKSRNGTGAQVSTPTIVDGVITEITVLNGGTGYSLNDIEISVIETGNILIPITNNIGKLNKINPITVGLCQNADASLKPEILIRVKCTISNVVGTLIVGNSISTTTGKFTGVIESWDSYRRILVLKNVNGFLFDGDTLQNQNVTVTVVQSGQPFLYTENSSISVLGGRFLTSQSIISSSYQKITDSLYYQDFSYVIKSEVPINNYKNIVLDTIHPAGFALFGELLLIDDLNIVQTVIEDNIDFISYQLFVDSTEEEIVLVEEAGSKLLWTL